MSDATNLVKINIW